MLLLQGRPIGEPVPRPPFVWPDSACMLSRPLDTFGTSMLLLVHVLHSTHIQHSACRIISSLLSRQRNVCFEKCLDYRLGHGRVLRTKEGGQSPEGKKSCTSHRKPSRADSTLTSAADKTGGERPENSVSVALVVVNQSILLLRENKD